MVAVPSVGRRHLSRNGTVVRGAEMDVILPDAEAAGVRRKQLTRMASNGVIERVLQGVHRMTGAPEHPHERILATWLALGGHQGAQRGTPPIVAAGETAAILHDVGDFFLKELEFIVQQRKSTRLQSVKLRIRALGRAEVIVVHGVATLKVERLIADLLDVHTDLSLVANVMAQAHTAGKLVSTSVREFS